VSVSSKFCALLGRGLCERLNSRPTGASKGKELSHCAPPLQKRNVKSTDFLDTMFSKVLGDLRFILNQPLKLAND